MYIRRVFTTGGGGLTYGGTAYAATEAGITAFATAIFAEAAQSVIVIQSGFEGGYSTGQINLDRGLLILGKRARTPCYVRQELLSEVAFVGVQARVVGTQYRPLGNRPFVLVESIEVSGLPAEDP